MTSPADELRATATKLRKTAEGTTPTPWRVHLRYYRKNPSVLAGAELETPVHTYGISLKRPHLLADAQWKALVSPALAEPLADLLDSIAAEWDKPSCDAPETCNRCAEPDPVVIDALRTVLALNGGQ